MSRAKLQQFYELTSVVSAWDCRYDGHHFGVFVAASKCTFDDKTFCGWTKGGDFDLETYSGQTLNGYIGPQTDHTRSNPAGSLFVLYFFGCLSTGVTQKFVGLSDPLSVFGNYFCLFGASLGGECETRAMPSVHPSVRPSGRADQTHL